MEELLRICLALAILLVTTAAQTVTPKNFTGNSNLGQTDNIIVSVSKGNAMMPVAPVVGLTSSARDDIPPTGISGPAVRTDSMQYNPQPNQIAIISCDPYSGYLDAWEIFSAAVQANVTGVLFYSQQADYCDLENYSASLRWIYSMKSLNDTMALLNDIGPTESDTGEIYAAIGFPNALRVINGTAPNGGGSNGGTQNQNPLGPSPSTAVAMIILYSITGLITALFLAIIVTGAWRAHRHPERYGPRNIIGRPRQSRAKGLARAMLETLPIVKFGEREEPKTTDVELADAGDTTGRETTARDAGTTAATNEQTEPSGPEEAQEPVSSTPADGIAAADHVNAASSDNSDNQGCSICTEDFEAGQDQRVLPCDHRFHPACVDPWLLNVSGTCPLCRIDLRPDTSISDGTREFDEDGNPVLQEGEFAPPVGPGETADAQQRMTIRRSIIIGLMGIRPDRLSREERVLALRQLRGQQLARQRREEQANVPETEEEEVSTRTRLRNLLGIRTRQTGQNNAEESTQTTNEHQNAGDDTTE